MSESDQRVLLERHHLARQEVSELRNLIALHMASGRADRLPDDLAREVELYLSLPSVHVDGLAGRELVRLVAVRESEERYARGLLRAVSDVIGPTQLQSLYESLLEARTNPASQTLGELIAEIEREMT